MVAAGIIMWPIQATDQKRPAAPSQQAKCHLIEVMHYGGNLICHDRLESNVVGSGNNMMGLSRVEAMNTKNCVAKK